MTPLFQAVGLDNDDSDTYDEDVGLEDEEEESEGNLEDFYTSDEEESLIGQSGGEDEEEWGGIESQEDEESPFPSESPADTVTTPPQPGMSPFRVYLSQLTASGEGVYVPPHLRKAQNKQSEAQLKLKRQLKGLLNRSVPLFLLTSTRPNAVLECPSKTLGQFLIV